jgi:hypothetical protein
MRHGEAYAQWSYSGFKHFRTELAKEAGITLSEMNGFGGARSWSKAHDDIVPLLNHSDCDGELSPEDCARVAPRLRQLVASWPDNMGIVSTPQMVALGYKPNFSISSHDKVNAMRLADAMEAAAKDGQKLEFR